MVDKFVKHVKRARAEAWGTFGRALKPVGYHYYTPPEAVKYRYPAPGSCALEEHDHPNLFKNDWKTPFRHSEFNIQPIERTYWDDDAEQAEHFISKMPEEHPDFPRWGRDDSYIKDMDKDLPDVGSDEMKNELWAAFGNQEDEMKSLRLDFAPGQQDYDDDYNQLNIMWNNRTLTGMDNDPRMKEMFVELEYWVEDVIGAKRVLESGVNTYKGQPKKW